MSAVLLIAATILSASSRTIYPTTTKLGGSAFKSTYLLSTFGGDDLISFDFSLKSVSSCSGATLTVIYPWSGKTSTISNLSAGKVVSYKKKEKLPNSSALRTVTVALVDGSGTCKITLNNGKYVYDGITAEDVASLAVGILIALIVGGIVCCILIVVCIVCMCRRGSNTTTVVQQQPQYQPMVNDGYRVPSNGKVNI